MKVVKTEIEGLLIMEPRIFEDSRGYFFESYNEKTFRDAGLDLHFIQFNESRSNFGVIRGLHYQLLPRAQTKLVRVLQGKIWDVAVDIRKKSPTYLKWLGLELSEENKKQLLIPKGFAHGFSVQSEYAVVLYKCDDFYAPDSEAGINFDDETLGVDWKIAPGKRIVSQKDLALPLLEKARMNF